MPDPEWKKLERLISALRKLVKAQNRLLVCYRTGNNRSAGKAIDDIRKYQATVDDLTDA